MKRSWKKKASVWTMAAAMTVSYIPQYSFAEETTENIKQETQTQTIEEHYIGEPDIRGFGDRECSRDVFADTN